MLLVPGYQGLEDGPQTDDLATVVLDPRSPGLFAPADVVALDRAKPKGVFGLRVLDRGPLLYEPVELRFDNLIRSGRAAEIHEEYEKFRREQGLRD
jgi:hypothetical protein